MRDEDLPHVQDSDLVEQEVVDLPLGIPSVYKIITATNLAVGYISRFLNTQPREQKVIAVDCEWELGRRKADLDTAVGRSLWAKMKYQPVIHL